MNVLIQFVLVVVKQIVLHVVQVFAQRVISVLIVVNVQHVGAVAK